MSTAFHPETDGQTERMNRVLEDVLRHYIDPTQSNWEECLPEAEFSINNAKSQTTKFTPFYLCNGFNPRTPIIGALPASQQARLDIEERQALLAQAKTSIQRAQDRQKIFVDQHRSEEKFEVGDFVMLSSKNIKMRKGYSKKLFPKFLGPFPIEEKIGKVAYRLTLPSKWKIHPVFHVSLLKNYNSPTDSTRKTKPLPLYIDDDGDCSFDVEMILNHRPLSCKDPKKVSFFVSWKGYGPEHDSWEPAKMLSSAQGAIAEYWRQQTPLEVESVLEHQWSNTHIGPRTLETAEYLVHWKGFGIGFDSFEPFSRLQQYIPLINDYWKNPVIIENDEAQCDRDPLTTI